MKNLTFYATISSNEIRTYMPSVPVLLPASSWARRNMSVPKLPPHITERAADSGGFVATLIWGDYRYTPEEYVAWLKTFSPSWAATMDYCCEPEIAANKEIIKQRQERTTEMAYRFWRKFRSAPWAWVPTVQGWNINDYQRHASELKPLILEMQKFYQSNNMQQFRVGIGTLCRRVKSDVIHEIVSAVAAELPDIPLHLWGVKLGLLKRNIALPRQVSSIDSAAWNGFFGKAHNEVRASGLTKQQFAYTVALPRYMRKLNIAMSKPKQQSFLLYRHLK